MATTQIRDEPKMFYDLKIEISLDFGYINEYFSL